MRRHGNPSLKGILFGGAIAALIAALIAGVQAASELLEDGASAIEVRTVRANATPATVPPIEPAAAAGPDQGRPIPRSITIDDIELWSLIRPVGLDEDGNVEIPDRPEVGWYEFGGVPGGAGATVLVGHVTWGEAIGPFYSIRHLEPGARIEVDIGHRHVRVYEVVERTMYAKRQLPADRVWRSTGAEALVLITCGGGFDERTRHFDSNVVVYAVPVA
jgi:hypothetical protein